MDPDRKAAILALYSELHPTPAPIPDAKSGLINPIFDCMFASWSRKNQYHSRLPTDFDPWNILQLLAERPVLSWGEQDVPNPLFNISVLEGYGQPDEDDESTKADVRQLHLDYTPSSPSLVYGALLNNRDDPSENQEYVARLAAKMRATFGAGNCRFVLDLQDEEVFGPRALRVLSEFLIELADLHATVDPLSPSLDWKIVKCDANWVDANWWEIDYENDPRPTGDVPGVPIRLLGMNGMMNRYVTIEVGGITDTFFMAYDYEFYRPLQTGIDSESESKSDKSDKSDTVSDTDADAASDSLYRYQKTIGDIEAQRLSKMLSKSLTKEDCRSLCFLSPYAKVEHCLKYDQVLVTADPQVATYALYRSAACMYINEHDAPWYDVTSFVMCRGSR